MVIHFFLAALEVGNPLLDLGEKVLPVDGQLLAEVVVEEKLLAQLDRAVGMLAQKCRELVKLRFFQAPWIFEKSVNERMDAGHVQFRVLRVFVYPSHASRFVMHSFNPWRMRNRATRIASAVEASRSAIVALGSSCSYFISSIRRLSGGSF